MGASDPGDAHGGVTPVTRPYIKAIDRRLVAAQAAR